MSRSKKKTPRSGDEKDKFFKRYENRRLRKLPFEHTLNHNTYKKYGECWNICDYETVGISFERYVLFPQESLCSLQAFIILRVWPNG